MLKNYFLAGLTIAVIAWSLHRVYPTYVEYKKTQRELHQIDRNLLNRQRVNETFRKNIFKLKSYPRSIERVAREKFGWCKAGEKIYDFNEPKTQEHEQGK